MTVPGETKTRLSTREENPRRGSAPDPVSLTGRRAWRGWVSELLTGHPAPGRLVQAIRVAGRTIPFAEGESLRTERSYKYTLAGFRALAAGSGWSPEASWTDPDQWFSVHYLQVPTT